MPAYFIPVAAAEGIHPDAPQRPAVWLENGKAKCSDADWNSYGPEGRALLQEEMDRLEREHAAQVEEMAKQPPAFIPPRSIAPASALERAARDLAKAGVSLLAAGNALKSALPNVDIAEGGDDAE